MGEMTKRFRPARVISASFILTTALALLPFWVWHLEIYGVCIAAGASRDRGCIATLAAGMAELAGFGLVVYAGLRLLRGGPLRRASAGASPAPR